MINLEICTALSNIDGKRAFCQIPEQANINLFQELFFDIMERLLDLKY